MPNLHDNIPSVLSKSLHALTVWSAVCGRASMSGRVGKIFTVETAEGAEMIGVNDNPKQSLRSLRALR